MKILLVNDDGIQSSRLHYAKSILEKFGDVVTVAPKHEQSGKSVAITIDKIYYEKLEEKTYAIEGTPADCVTFALYGLNLEPDVVVSGVNRGYNLGIDTMYSGTVGAALQANYHGFKAIAFSGDFKGTEAIEADLESTFNYILNEDLLSHDYILNVNFQREKFGKAKAIKHTETTYAKFDLEGELTKTYFKSKRRRRKPGDADEFSDVHAIETGNVSIAKLAL